MKIEHARNASIITFLIFMSGMMTDGWRTFPNPVPFWGKILLVLIVVTNVICLPVGIAASISERRFGKTVVALSIIPLLYIAFISWIGIA